MSDFLLKVMGHSVQANRLIDGELEPIRFSGEEVIDLEEFWCAFKHKVEYVKDEQLAFIVLGDRDGFVIDPEITIADGWSNDMQDVLPLVEEQNNFGMAVTFYPDIDLSVKLSISHRPHAARKVQGVQSEANFSSDMLLDSNSLQGFYKRKTREYRRG